MKKEKKVEVKEIDGLKVILVKDEKKSVTVKALVKSGSREEISGQAGSAHFLEHFVFKGTKKFPGEFDIHEQVERIGGIHNAYTIWDQLAFYVTADKDSLPLITSLVGQMVSEPLLGENSFEREKGTILEELYMYEDWPDAKASDEVIGMTWKGNSLGRPIIGTVESLKEMKVADLRQYYTNWFDRSNVLVGVSGAWDNDEVVLDLVKKEFEGLGREGEKRKRDKYVASRQEKSQIKIIEKKLEQANVAFGFEGLSVMDEDKYALSLASLILGGGWMSRLYREVREKRGWAYRVGSDFDNLADTGIVLLSAGLPKAKVTDALGLMKEIALGLTEGKWQITKEEVEIAKGTIKGRMALTYDNSERVIGMALEDMMYLGRVRTFEERVKAYEAVTWEQVIDVCKKIFREEKMNLAVVGDYDKLEGI